MRTLLISTCLLAVTGCSTEQSCASRPTDPLCQDVDAGGDGGARDAGRDANADAGPLPDVGVDSGVDAHVPCNGACGGATPRCLPTTETCVACLGPSDCTAGTARVCDTAGDHTCVACVAETDCTGGTHCDTTARQCVACLTSEQCPTAAAARCDTGTHMCTTCTGNPDCAHLTGTGVCNASGACVQCTATDLGACTSGICLTSTSTCAPTGGATPTCGACTHDTDCGAGQLCVATTYDDPTTPAADPVPTGSRCLWRQDAAGAGAPNGDCTTLRPYVRASMLTSVDGVSTMTCTFRQSTCEAQAAFSATNCMTLDAAGDALCGLSGVHDGVCRMFGATTNRCSVFCGSDDDCPVGFACNTGASPRVCMF